MKAAAATTIQNKQRQKEAAKVVGDRRQETRAATSIQNKHRQIEATARVDRLKTEKNRLEMADDMFVIEVHGLGPNLNPHPKFEPEPENPIPKPRP